MSIVVANAYRLKRGKDVHDLAQHLREKLWPELRERLRIVYLGLMEDAVNPATRAAFHQEHADAKARMQGRAPAKLDEESLGDPFSPVDASDLVRSRYLAQTVRGERNEWDLDIWLRAWKVDGRIILSTKEEPISVLHRDRFSSAPQRQRSGMVLDYLKRCPGLEDFSYWDNVDKPRDVSAARWTVRRRAWEQVDGLRSDIIIPLMSVDILPSLCPAWHSPGMRKEWERVKAMYPREVLEKYGQLPKEVQRG